MTSGTTGVPKTTAHFHRDVLAVADTFSAHVLRPTADDLFLGSPPLAFTYGLGGELIFPLRAGAATLLIERPTPDVLADAVAEHGVTVLFTAPTAYRAMLAAGKVPAGLRRCVSAGEPLPRAVSDAFHEATGLRIIDGIGSTEMLHIFISAADDDVRPGSTGRPVPGYEAAVLDEAGAPVPDGQPGRLAVRGPTGCRYLADPRQQTYVQHGWNLTGDTYRRDEDGYFWYVARSDDMIISAGYNIAGPEVENALLSSPDVVECGVVAKPDPDRGNVVAAYVVLRPGVAGDAAKVAELQELVKRQIAPYKCPRVIEFLPELPHTPTGKLQRFKLRDAGGRLMRIAVIGGGPGGLYFSLLAKQLGPQHEIIGLGAQRPGRHVRLRGGVLRRDARRDRARRPGRLPGDGARVRPLGRHRHPLPARGRPPGPADHLRRARLRRDEPAHAARHPAGPLPRARRAAGLPDRGAGPGRAVRHPRPRGRLRRRQLRHPGQVRRPLRAHRRHATVPLHVARHRQGLRRVHLRRPAHPVRGDAGARLPLRRDRIDVHRGDARLGLAAGRVRAPGRSRRGRATPVRSR